jgi:YebC/PmpR family DNA-binding regulatory protein
MAGHSKWANIQHRKGRQDAKRGKIFTRLIKEITVASRMGGGDPDMNPRLRLAVDKATENNMPKDNIERAIKKGTGVGEAEAYEEVVYEGYGPGGAALYVETLTDNKNRTVGELRHALTKFGGNLGASGCVSYLFEKKGQLVFDRAGLDADKLLEAALESGADDVIETGDSIEVATTPGGFEALRRALEAAGWKPASAGIVMAPASTVGIQGAAAESMLRLVDALEDLDDVQNVYANYDISDEEMARFAS